MRVRAAVAAGVDLDDGGAETLVVDHLTVSRVAAGLDVAWHTANTAVLEEGRRLLIDDPERFDGVTVIGVDEHVWRHTRKGDKYVTVIIDLTPVRDRTGPGRLLDMVEGRSTAAFQEWLQQRDDAFKAAVDRHGDEIFGDIPKFTDVQPVVQLNDFPE